MQRNQAGDRARHGASPSPKLPALVLPEHALPANPCRQGNSLRGTIAAEAISIVPVRFRTTRIAPANGRRSGNGGHKRPEGQAGNGARGQRSTRAGSCKVGQKKSPGLGERGGRSPKPLGQPSGPGKSRSDSWFAAGLQRSRTPITTGQGPTEGRMLVVETGGLKDRRRRANVNSMFARLMQGACQH